MRIAKHIAIRRASKASQVRFFGFFFLLLCVLHVLVDCRRWMDSKHNGRSTNRGNRRLLTRVSLHIRTPTAEDGAAVDPASQERQFPRHLR